MGDGPITLSLRDRIAIWQEMAIYWIVWRIMPRWMAYHAFSRVWTAADEERSAERPYDSSPMTCEEAMRRWEGEPNRCPHGHVGCCGHHDLEDMPIHEQCV